jgi:hypothetical protein
VEDSLPQAIPVAMNPPAFNPFAFDDEPMAPRKKKKK